MAFWGQHAVGELRDPSFSSSPVQARLAVVLPLWNKVSVNKGPFHELQAGPLTTSKVIETGSQENSLLTAHGFVPTSRTQIMTTPSLWFGAGWKETFLYPPQGNDVGEKAGAAQDSSKVQPPPRQ